MNKYFNKNGDVAVLYSPGFGTGWYTWSSKNKQCLYDPEVVQWVLDGKPEDRVPNVDDGRYGKYFYAGGMRDLVVEWLKPGTLFRIDEYDGSESLVRGDEQEWEVA